MLKTSLITLLSVFTVVNQPTTLQLIEEQLEKVIMIHCVEYEQGSGVNGGLKDVQIAYTGNNTVDAKKDSGFYYIQGTYTFDKYTNVNTQVFGNLPNQSYSKSSSTSYLAKVKQVLDDYRVQEIVIIEDPRKFDFASFDYESFKTTSDMLYPEVLFREKVRKEEPENKKDKKKKD